MVLCVAGRIFANIRFWIFLIPSSSLLCCCLVQKEVTKFIEYCTGNIEFNICNK